MKRLLRSYFTSLVALWITSVLIPGLEFSGGLTSLSLGAATFMLINSTVVPLLKILFLPLNLLTFGFFTWVINVLALFVMTSTLPQLKLVPYYFPGAQVFGMSVNGFELNTLFVAVAASFLIGLIINIIKWLIH